MKAMFNLKLNEIACDLLLARNLEPLPSLRNLRKFMFLFSTCLTPVKFMRLNAALASCKSKLSAAASQAGPKGRRLQVRTLLNRTG